MNSPPADVTQIDDDDENTARTNTNTTRTTRDDAGSIKAPPLDDETEGTETKTKTELSKELPEPKNSSSSLAQVAAPSGPPSAGNASNADGEDAAADAVAKEVVADAKRLDEDAQTQGGPFDFRGERRLFLHFPAGVLETEREGEGRRTRRTRTRTSAGVTPTTPSHP